jgi:hypothetical protein
MRRRVGVSPVSESDDRDARTRDARPSAAEGRLLDRLILPYFTELALWPILLVAILSLATVGAAILLLAIHDRNYYALGALLILAGMSVDAVLRDLRHRRLGPASGLIVALWLLSALVAAGAARIGLF